MKKFKINVQRYICILLCLYKLPKKWVNQIFLNQMKAFVSIENVATFTSLPSGIDPERIEWNYPAFRTVSFGVNITL